MVTKKSATKKRVPIKRVSRTESTETVKSKSERNTPTSVPLVLYRRIALAFVVVVSVVLMIVIYLSTVRAVIRIRPIARNVSSDLIAQIVSVPINPSEIHGTVVVGKLGKTKTFTPSGDGIKQVEEKAGGEVMITNKGNVPQGLVASTRLLSKDQILFRLDKTVTVPAGGSVKATVHADQKGSTGNIAPTHFTIPGLSETKQQIIFADSSVAFTGGIQTISIISQKEMDTAVDTLKEEVLNDAKDLLRGQAGKGFDGEVFTTELLDKSFSIKPETEVKSYDVTVNVSAVGVFYDAKALQTAMKKHLYEGLGQGEEFVGLDENAINVKIDRYNQTQKTASLHVNIEGRVMTTRTSQSLNVGRFMGMRAQEVTELLKKEGVAEDATVDFFPFWIRCVPRLKDRIFIELK